MTTAPSGRGYPGREIALQIEQETAAPSHRRRHDKFLTVKIETPAHKL